mmetsp:Transcript_72516/g.193366  ORF Transcript_72516/g.193366 Transcript_72516/m.193366 type:complete len:233 (-) Transcript_72516:444-1142(-)
MILRTSHVQPTPGPHDLACPLELGVHHLECSVGFRKISARPAVEAAVQRGYSLGGLQVHEREAGPVPLEWEHRQDEAGVGCGTDRLVYQVLDLLIGQDSWDVANHTRCPQIQPGLHCAEINMHRGLYVIVPLRGCVWEMSPRWRPLSDCPLLRLGLARRLVGPIWGSRVPGQPTGHPDRRRAVSRFQHLLWGADAVVIRREPRGRRCSRDARGAGGGPRGVGLLLLAPPPAA